MKYLGTILLLTGRSYREKRLFPGKTSDVLQSELQRLASYCSVHNLGQSSSTESIDCMSTFTFSAPIFLSFFSRPIVVLCVHSCVLFSAVFVIFQPDSVLMCTESCFVVGLPEYMFPCWSNFSWKTIYAGTGPAFVCYIQTLVNFGQPMGFKD